MSSEVSFALCRTRARAGAFASVLDDRFIKSPILKPVTHLEGELLATAQGIEKGTIEFLHLRCRSPKWVAARLWEHALSAQDDRLTLRTWVDWWNFLLRPEIIPSQVWDEDTVERFQQAAFHIIESEEALGSWQSTHDRFVKEIAVALDREPQYVQSSIPTPPETLSRTSALARR